MLPQHESSLATPSSSQTPRARHTPGGRSGSSSGGMPVRLLFIFLLSCAGVYYAFQFVIMANYGQASRQMRAPSRQSATTALSDDDFGDPAKLRPRRRKHRRKGAHLLNSSFAPSRRLPQGEHSQSEQSQQGLPATDHAQPQPQLKPSNGAAVTCTRTRRPYHVVMTAAAGLYQEWQSRIAYYHYQKMKRLHPCSDMGGFTRLFNNYGGKPDALMDEIPTVVVKQLGHGHCAECDRGFIVMTRPWGVVQFVESE
jgi:hypothetical protein